MKKSENNGMEEIGLVTPSPGLWPSTLPASQVWFPVVDGKDRVVLGTVRAAGSKFKGSTVDCGPVTRCKPINIGTGNGLVLSGCLEISIPHETKEHAVYWCYMESLGIKEFPLTEPTSTNINTS